MAGYTPWSSEYNAWAESYLAANPGKDGQDAWFQNYMATHPGTDPNILQYLRGITDNPASYENFLNAHANTLGDVNAFAAAIGDSTKNQGGLGAAVQEFRDATTTGDIFQNGANAIGTLDPTIASMQGINSVANQFGYDSPYSPQVIQGTENTLNAAGAAYALYAGGSALAGEEAAAGTEYMTAEELAAANAAVDAADAAMYTEGALSAEEVAAGAGVAKPPTTTTNPLTTALANTGVNLLATALTPKPDTAGLDAANTSAAIAASQWDYYLDHYQPAETAFINRARTAGSPEEIAAAEGRANADVTSAFDKARTSTENRLQSYGINPSSPSYESSVGSLGLAEGAASAGAITQAGNDQRDKADAMLAEAVKTGRNIPTQSIAGLNSASGANNNANAQMNATDAANTAAIGSLIQPFSTAVTSWWGTSSFAAGGKVRPASFDGKDIGGMLMEKGLHPDHAKTAITPHMRRSHKPVGYASGGPVSMDGMEPSQMNQAIQGMGTETSDSIPAEIDGQAPAKLSTNEFVLNAGVMDLTGEEIAQAINNAGLEKRGEAAEPEEEKAEYSSGGVVAKPESAPVGDGMAKQAIDKISARKRYEQAAMDAAEEGKSLPPFDQWYASMTGYARGGKVNYSSAGL